MKLARFMVAALVVGACTPAGVAPSAVTPSAVAPSVEGPSAVAPSVTAPSAVASSAPPPAPVATATLAAPGSPPPDATAATPGDGTPLLPDPSADHTIGERIVLSDFFEEEQAAITVLEAMLRPQSDPTSGPEYAFLVEIEGLTSSIHYNVLQFSMFDDESFEYPAQLGRQQPELNFGNLSKGRKVRGWLTFDGPDSSTSLELQWAPITADPVFVRVLTP